MRGERTPGVLAPAVAVFAFVIGVAASWVPSYWYDEAATVYSSRRSFSELLGAVAECRYHPRCLLRRNAFVGLSIRDRSQAETVRLTSNDTWVLPPSNFETSSDYSEPRKAGFHVEEQHTIHVSQVVRLVR